MYFLIIFLCIPFPHFSSAFWICCLTVNDTCLLRDLANKTWESRLPLKATILVKWISTQLWGEDCQQGYQSFALFPEEPVPRPPAAESVTSSHRSLQKTMEGLQVLTLQFRSTVWLNKCQQPSVSFLSFICRFPWTTWPPHAFCCMHEQKPPPRVDLQKIFLAEATWGQETPQLSAHSYSLRGEKPEARVWISHSANLLTNISAEQ